MKKQSGFALVELLVILVVIAGVIAIGYTAWFRVTAKNPPAQSSESAAHLNYTSPTTAAPAAPKVATASDLNTAMQTLNETNITASNVDNTQLSSQAGGF